MSDIRTINSTLEATREIRALESEIARVTAAMPSRSKALLLECRPALNKIRASLGNIRFCLSLQSKTDSLLASTQERLKEIASAHATAMAHLEDRITAVVSSAQTKAIPAKLPDLLPIVVASGSNAKVKAQDLRWTADKQGNTVIHAAYATPEMTARVFFKDSKTFAVTLAGLPDENSWTTVAKVADLRKTLAKELAHNGLKAR